MLSKKQEKLVRLLRTKKGRNAEKLFVIEGSKLVEEAMAEEITFHTCFATQTWIENNTADLECIVIDEREMQRISSLKNAPGVLAIVAFIQFKKQTKSCDLSLLLDDIKDPGNLGTIIRTAETFGVSQIICSPETVDVYNEKVVQASMGSIFRLPLFVEDLTHYIQQIPKAETLYLSSLEGKNMYELELKTPAHILLGSESHGIKGSLLKMGKMHLKVPQMGKVESMNVSIAAAVILAEFRRRIGSK
ncbi:MAG: RNA methyltransferase [Flavobacteriales bacterium]|nr:RNA methyltransferase [Flavobacteriales bacterium]